MRDLPKLSRAHSSWQEAGDLNKDNSSGEQTQEPKTPAKKPYTPPSFRFEKVFEVAALACGKVHSTEHNCRVSRKSS